MTNLTLKQRRQALGLTQREIGQMADLNESTIRCAERGDHVSPLTRVRIHIVLLSLEDAARRLDELSDSTKEQS